MNFHKNHETADKFDEKTAYQLNSCKSAHDINLTAWKISKIQYELVGSSIRSSQ